MASGVMLPAKPPQTSACRYQVLRQHSAEVSPSLTADQEKPEKASGKRHGLEMASVTTGQYVGSLVVGVVVLGVEPQVIEVCPRKASKEFSGTPCWL